MVFQLLFSISCKIEVIIYWIYLHLNLVFVTLLLTSSLNAAYEKIKIGTISSEHKNNITVVQLKKMIDEIEYIFESQLGFNVFDYSSNGKPIDILYVSKNAAEKRLNTKIRLQI